MKAVVLASGDGEGLRPFTYTASPAMLPVLGRPLLEPLIEWLARHGFDEIVIVVANFPRQIENYFRDGRRWGVRLAYSEQAERRGGPNQGSRFGTAAALRHLHARSGFLDQTAVIVSADLWTDLDLGAMLAAHRATGASCTAALHTGLAAARSALRADAAGRLSLEATPSSPASPPESSAPPVAPIGVYLLEPHALGLIPRRDDADFAADLIPELVRGRGGLRGHTGIFNWMPVRDNREYWDLLEAALRNDFAGFAPDYPEVCAGVRVGADVRIDYAQCRLEGPVWVGGGSVIEPGAEILGPAWIGGGCRIGSGVRLERCIVEDNTRLGQRLELSRQVIVGNRAVNARGDIEILVEADPGPEAAHDRRESDRRRESLLQLAARIDRR